jgi:hypothetical protein
MSTKIQLSPNAMVASNQTRMIELGLHPPYINIDKSVFIKTEAERDIIKLGKTIYKQRNKSR